MANNTIKTFDVNNVQFDLEDVFARNGVQTLNTEVTRLAGLVTNAAKINKYEYLNMQAGPCYFLNTREMFQGAGIIIFVMWSNGPAHIEWVFVNDQSDIIVYSFTNTVIIANNVRLAIHTPDEIVLECAGDTPSNAIIYTIQ